MYKSEDKIKIPTNKIVKTTIVVFPTPLIDLQFFVCNIALFATLSMKTDDESCTTCAFEAPCTNCSVLGVATTIFSPQ